MQATHCLHACPNSVGHGLCMLCHAQVCPHPFRSDDISTSTALLVYISVHFPNNPKMSGMQQMTALRLVAQFPELVPADWSAQCSVACTCPMWKHVRDTKCSPPVMNLKEWCAHVVAAWMWIVQFCDQNGYHLFQMRGIDTVWEGCVVQCAAVHQIFR